MNKYPNAVFKGFCTIQEGINFLLADNSFTNCCKIPVILNDDSVRSVAEFDHECGNNKQLSPSNDEKEMPGETDECSINDILNTSLTLVKPLGNTMIENGIANKDIDLCPSCNVRANEKTIQCNNCTKWYHFRCTHLPNYQLYIYNTTNRKYTCQKCVEVSAPTLDLQTLKTENTCTSAHTHTNITEVLCFSPNTDSVKCFI